MPRDGSDESDFTADVGIGHVPRDDSDGSDSTTDVGTGQVSRDAQMDLIPQQM